MLSGDRGEDTPEHSVRARPLAWDTIIIWEISNLYAEHGSGHDS
jgi:hypothetical protein